MVLKKILLTGLLGLTFTLTGCGDKKVPDPVEPDPEPVIPTIDWDQKDYIAKGGSYGGYFSDINVERKLCSETTYNFMFQSNHATNKTYVVKSTDSSIGEIVRKDGDNKNFDIKCKAQGDIILTIENADGILVYRNIVRVRNAIKTDEMNTYLRSVDRFETPQEYALYFGTYKMSFDYLDEFDGKFCGIIKGGDDYDPNMNKVFTIEFDTFLPDRDCYSYKITEVYSETQLTFIEYLNISRTGDWMYLYEDEIVGTGGLLTMLVPKTIN